MTTVTDIANRALQMLGSRTNMTITEYNSMTSNEAIQINLIYSIVTDWCHAAANWNFARKTAALTISKSFTGSPWTSAQPPPPWINEYALPTDLIRAIYTTNNTITNPGQFDGQPQRFVIATDSIAAVQQQVLLSNQSVVNLVYTSRIADPTLWPALFERFAVASIANAVAFQLTGDHNIATQVREQMMSFFQIAEQQNKVEGLAYLDTTPEWTAAVGIQYPSRRQALYPETAPIPPPQRQQ
jgi:hypothetical protein